MTEPNVDKLFKQAVQLHGAEQIEFLAALAPDVRQQIESLLAAAALGARITDVGHVAQWPAARFIQPLNQDQEPSLSPGSTSAALPARAAD